MYRACSCFLKSPCVHCRAEQIPQDDDLAWTSPVDWVEVTATVTFIDDPGPMIYFFEDVEV